MRSLISSSVTLFIAFGTVATVTTDATAQRLAVREIARGVDSPVGLFHAPGDHSRLFIIGRSNGNVYLVKDGVLQPTPFLNIGPYRAEVDGGFLSVAFHPNYQSNGYFFVYFTDINGDGVVKRYSVSGNPDLADPNSAVEIIKFLRNPQDDLHAGGFMAFSPTDGYLYVGHGDAGPQGDPLGNGQNRSILLGKVIRIDIDSGSPYAIPADNPFVNEPNTRPEIWSIGFRNPWRGSFDRLTGDIWLGDVGYNTWEEVDYIPANFGGGNYGWNIKEATHCFNPPNNCDPNGELIDPVYEYRHRYTPPFRCSVTGGYVYRGQALPLYQGRYFFGDYCGNATWSFAYDGNQVIDFRDHTDEISPPGGGIFSLSSYGEDEDGEMYVCDYARDRVYKIVSAMELTTTTLNAGSQATLSISGATPNANVYFVYSLAGTGSTPVPPLGVTLALRNPQLIGSDAANAAGAASLVRTVPANARGVRVWLQAAEAGNTTNVVSSVID